MAAAAVFGHYRLLTLLGRGGMGEVWRARDTRKGRDVALKILGAWLGAEPDYARRFRREAALAARLNAPLIVGSDLDELITREGPLDPTRGVDVIQQVAAALDAAHDEGLIHRDVKPSNVLVTAHRGRDFVYLIDFGIAHSANGTRLTTIGRELGTLAYMAPERFDGGSDDRRADVYALTCVLFQALTGQAPFEPPTTRTGWPTTSTRTCISHRRDPLSATRRYPWRGTRSSPAAWRRTPNSATRPQANSRPRRIRS